MKPWPPLITLAALASAAPAAAQNAGQIAKARAGASCPGCNLFQAELSGAELGARNYSRSRLRQSNLSLAVMTRASFAGADLRDVDAYGGVFTGANFSGADLSNASFVGTSLQGANFRGARLNGTNFSGAEMQGASGLTQGQLAGACGDAATRPPAGLRLPACR